MKQSGIMKLGLMAFTCSMASVSNAAVVINEVDYDQPGTDTSEFIELFNSSSSAVLLDNYFIDLVNGSNSSSYRTIDLSGYSIDANGYFVMCGDASLVANCNHSFTSTNSWFQNGSPDAVALYENSNLLDSLSYEGELQPLSEGTILAISDNNTDIISISRIPNGLDSDSNATDFQLGCITPGSANIAGSGDCSVTSVSAVPVPAAVWLFGSGILGLMGFARRNS
ncbi:MAG: lamin tail domain-containing protein [Gammaproteobacteria bacterium]|nr:lamin tail domain-containing protein [Gammaproteobacteria bacterium]